MSLLNSDYFYVDLNNFGYPKISQKPDQLEKVNVRWKEASNH